MKVLLFGGSGKLGKALIRFDKDIIAPAHSQCNILKIEEVKRQVKEVEPDIIIHAAALVGAKECNQNKPLAWQVNVEGTENIVQVCRDNKIRMIFISSAAIFDGNKGNYTENDNPSPTFYYAITKVAAEQTVKQLLNYCIIRLDFFSPEGLKYDQVFIDHITSKIHVDEAAKKIIQIAKETNFNGIINIGQESKPLYDILRPYHPSIKPITIKESSLPNFPKNISLDLSKWNECFGK